MHIGSPPTRRLALLAAAGASALAGMVMVWVFAPGNFGGLGTGQLVAIVALILLPVLAAWAVRADRRAQRLAAALQKHRQRQAALDAQITPQRVERRSVIHEPAYEPASTQQKV